MFKNILVPLDESDLSERALPVAKELAGRLGATIHLLEAVQPQAELFSGPDSMAGSQYQVEAMRNSMEIQIKCPGVPRQCCGGLSGRGTASAVRIARGCRSGID